MLIFAEFLQHNSWAVSCFFYLEVDGVNTPSVCQSVADRDEETGNTTVDEKEATPEVMCTYLSLVSRIASPNHFSARPQCRQLYCRCTSAVFYWILFLTLFCISIQDNKLLTPVPYTDQMLTYCSDVFHTLTRW
ncbi:hypothetical protein EB796_023532 [Bugula neritina]|uniref:Uncharacterized protein n=1 Tax=Bugula neritina TaxID=10212 RepID=A0A7J7IXB8_BUGNE|nr:hypothetical protein EB796_023532 [Bugula neritina]